MAQFIARLNELGLQFMQGARFWHVLDASAGKDQAANWIIATYQQLSGRRPNHTWPGAMGQTMRLYWR
ncbi:mannosyl-3-phosphoglycerate phosphatase [Escherichia coli]|uniref:Mannosyl-3-phosphoglycerate phosphatase n=1 Tax=Escherichia coli TaxID=562 RepID=A0A377K4Q0_ECOLX|nr:mannosyl-3-phosphoglycerate phosphatase [Escherichia coli]